MSKITLKEVAKAAGVSRTTASNAFNRPDQLSATLRQKVLRVATELGYTGPDPTARMLRTKKAEAIGLVFAEALPFAFDDPTAIAFLRGVASVCESENISLLIVPTSAEETARITIQQASVDGFILYCMANDSLAVKQVVNRELPIVTVDQTAWEGVSSVTIDDYQAACKATSHLIELQHRQFAILAMELKADNYVGAVTPHRLARATYSNALDRWKGYTDTLQAAGIDREDVPIEECIHNSEQNATIAATKLLSQQPRPTAILAMSDRLAIGVLRAAEHLGLNVPQDVSVVGFDDIPLASQLTPSLTTIQQPLIQKGKFAAELLLKRTDVPEQIVLNTQLIVRASSGLAPKL